MSSRAAGHSKQVCLSATPTLRNLRDSVLARYVPVSSFGRLVARLTAALRRVFARRSGVTGAHRCP